MELVLRGDLGRRIVIPARERRLAMNSGVPRTCQTLLTKLGVGGKPLGGVPVYVDTALTTASHSAHAYKPFLTWCEPPYSP